MSALKYGAGIKDINHLRELEGEPRPRITDEWLLLVTEPNGRGRSYAMTIAEFRFLFVKTPESAE